jgi:hypothetical protein
MRVDSFCLSVADILCPCTFVRCDSDVLFANSSKGIFSVLVLYASTGSPLVKFKSGLRRCALYLDVDPVAAPLFLSLTVP